MVERLDDEYTKLLQNADSRSPVYVARLGVRGECGEVCMQSLVHMYLQQCRSVGLGLLLLPSPHPLLKGISTSFSCPHSLFPPSFCLSHYFPLPPGFISSILLSILPLPLCPSCPSPSPFAPPPPPFPACRLKDEAKVTELIRKAQDFISSDTAVDRDSNLCRVYMRRIEHLYCKVSSDHVCSLCSTPWAGHPNTRT